MRPFLHFTAACSLVLLVACATGGIVSISEPSIGPSNIRATSLDETGVLHLGGFSMSVKPQNARVGLITVGPIIPLIPVGLGNELGKGERFRLVVQFETEEPGLTFRPGESVLFYSGVEYLPFAAVGPLASTATARELQRASRGHEWVCNDVIREWKHELEQDESIPPSRSCFVLQFPITTLSPDQLFQVELRGIRKNGHKVTLPRIEFRPGTTGGYSVLG